ncbi:MAG: heavy metal-associated domain-containing protein [Candidatus Kapabacteria bacterium]|nr:heavy metal-associated domain-containing protein [Candidatus Kapabacteria bacterium]
MTNKRIISGLVSVLLLFFVLSNYSFAAAEAKEVKIKTSAVCDMCKAKIEKAVKRDAGVSAVDLDVKTKIVTVKYDEAKTNPDKIKLMISRAGYDADAVKADPRAYTRLPKCCKADTK